MTTKIYITLKESEHLVFKKCLIVPKERLKITQAQALFSIDLSLNTADLIEVKEAYLILFSAVQVFGIPVKEERLFINHFKVPAGIISFADRQIRDADTADTEIPFEDEELLLDRDYLNIRNGIIGAIHHAHQLQAAGYEGYNINSALQTFNHLSTLKKELFLGLKDQDSFPILRIKIDGFKIDSFFRITWWAKLISNQFLNESLFESDDKYNNARSWLKQFLNYEDINSLNKQLKEVPAELKVEINFLLGYYIAALQFESYDLKSTFIVDLYEEIEYEDKDEMFNWISFFLSYFDNNASQIYFIKSLQSQICNIEKGVFKLVQSQYERPVDLKLIYEELDKSVLVTEYVQLTSSQKIKSLELLQPEDVMSVFENHLSNEKIKSIGFEILPPYKNSSIHNYAVSSNERFYLMLNEKINTKDVVFYLNPKSNVEKYLKRLNVKRRLFNKLFERKKVLVGFMKQDNFSSLFDLYATLLKEEVDKTFEKVVIVYLVDLSPEETQSLEFSELVRLKANELKMTLHENLELIVKNIRNDNDVEIKRNLKILLDPYKTNQIEVIHENFEMEKARWLIESTNDYYIDDGQNKYYSILNLD